MPKLVKFPINSEILKWARESLKLDAVEASKKLGLTKEKLLSFESGEALPSYSQLKKFGKTYKRVTGVFFLEKVPKDAVVPKDYRVVSESEIVTLDSSTYINIRDAQRKREDVIELYRLSEWTVPSLSQSAKTTDDVSKLAKTFRDLIKIDFEKQSKFSSDHAAFNFWKSEIEGLGALVFQASFKSLKELRGLAYFEKKFPLILLNTKDEPRPRTFSLLHEYCHLILHVSGIGNMSAEGSRGSNYNSIEVFCNEFAGEVLVPRELLLLQPEMKKIADGEAVSLERVKTLANRFKASNEVILRKLLDLDFIKKEAYEDYRREVKRLYSKRPKKKQIIRHDVKINAYNGKVLTEAAVHSFLNRKISKNDLSRYLSLKLSHIEKLRPEVVGRFV